MRTTLLVLFFTGLATTSFAACSDAPKRPAVLADGPAVPVGGGGGSGATGDGGTVSDAGATVDSGDGGTCTDLDNSTTEIEQNGVPGDVPAGTGGTIEDGTYDLTEASIYVGAAGTPGPTGIRIREAIRITGTTYERAFFFVNSAGASSEIRSTGKFTPNGTNATIALTCPGQNQESVTYSVTSTGLTVANIVTKEAYVFAKRP